MGIKTYKPTTPTLRYRSNLSFDEITKKKAEKSLTKGLHFKAGRSHGRISVRHKGGRHKRLYRIIDFKRDKNGIIGVVHSIEYDPNRTAFIALIHYVDGEKRYIIAPKELKVGDKIQSGNDAPIKLGNTLPLEKIPVGTTIYNIELQLGKGAQLARSAGTSALIMAMEKDYAVIKLPSGEMRMIYKKCHATVGRVGNEDVSNVSLGKAGNSRKLGIRPSIRGVAMNPHDHPHGGGEGKTASGRHPVTPWGKPTRGYKTRNKKNRSNAFIISRRKK